MNLSQVCTLERPPLVLRARTAADLMTPNPASLRETATAREAAGFLTGQGVSDAPVVNAAGAPVGVLSRSELVIHDRARTDFPAARRRRGKDFGKFEEVHGEPRGAWRDFLTGAPECEAQVRDLMTPAVFTVRLEAPASQVVEDMLALRAHRLFVVDGDGALVGVVTAADVLRRLEPALEQDV
jgi:CBS domain-containing protein